MTVASACEQLGIKEAQFHRIRRKALSGALAGLQPGTPGRKPKLADARDERIAELEARVDELETELETAELRVEIATTLPNLLQEQARLEEAKKKESEEQARARAKRAAAKRARKSAKKKRRRNRS